MQSTSEIDITPQDNQEYDFDGESEAPLTTGYSKIKPAKTVFLPTAFPGHPYHARTINVSRRGRGRGRGKSVKGSRKNTGTKRTTVRYNPVDQALPNRSNLITEYIPKSSKFPAIDPNVMEIKRVSGNRMFITFPETTDFTIIGYSKGGILMSQQKGTIYFRLSEAYDNKHEYKAKSLGYFMKRVDDFLEEAARTLRPTMIEEWGEGAGGVLGDKIIIEGGYKHWLRLNQHKSGVALENGFFPHPQYTKCYTYDTKTQATSQTMLERLITTSAISTFFVNYRIKKLQLSIDPVDNETVTVLHWGSIDTLTWVNEGQDCLRAAKESALLKEKEAEQRRLAVIDEMASSFLNSSSSSSSSSSVELLNCKAM